MIIGPTKLRVTPPNDRRSSDPSICGRVTSEHSDGPQNVPLSETDSLLLAWAFSLSPSRFNFFQPLITCQTGYPSIGLLWFCQSFVRAKCRAQEDLAAFCIRFGPETPGRFARPVVVTHQTRGSMISLQDCGGMSTTQPRLWEYRRGRYKCLNLIRWYLRS